MTKLKALYEEVYYCATCNVLWTLTISKSQQGSAIREIASVRTVSHYTIIPLGYD